MTSAAALTIAACTVGDLSLEGRPCPCVAGFVCGPAGRCVRDVATADAAPDTGADGGPACTLSRWPEAPGGTESGSFSFVTAFREVRTRAPADFSIPTYDLDNTCTCPEPPRCRPRGEIPCDDPGGVDDALSKVLAGNELVGTALDMTGAIGAGRYGLLVRVSDYNGEPDDPHVRTELFFSYGLEGVQAIPDGGVRPTPKFDGTDVYTVATFSLEQGGRTPPYVGDKKDGAAYVRGGVLVSKIAGSAQLNDELAVSIRDAVLVARIGRSGSSFVLEEGRLGGVLPVSPLLTSLSRTKIGGAPVCKDHPLFPTIRDQLCGAADAPILRELPLDAPCSAITTWAAFRGANASLGTIYDTDPPPGGCGPDYDAGCE